MRKLALSICLIVISLLFAIQSEAWAAKTFRPGDKVKVLWQNKWHACTIMEAAPGKYNVRFEDDERMYDKWVSAKLVENFSYKNGDIILVRKKGAWVNGRVIASGTIRYKIHYDGQESKFDEWVGPERIKDVSYDVDEIVMVKWNGDWYKAKILRYKDGKYQVHYIGFNDVDDEWVPVGRISRIKNSE